MNPKMRADFINSVGSRQKIPCPVCNTLNEPDYKFCVVCGHPLKQAAPVRPDKKICPSCHAENDLSASFCVYCGTRLDAEQQEQKETAFPVTDTASDTAESTKPQLNNPTAGELPDDTIITPLTIKIQPDTSSTTKTQADIPTAAEPQEDMSPAAALQATVSTAESQANMSAATTSTADMPATAEPPVNAPSAEESPAEMQSATEPPANTLQASEPQVDTPSASELSADTPSAADPQSVRPSPLFNPVKRPAHAPFSGYPGHKQSAAAEKLRAFKFAEPEVEEDAEESVSVFAEGLPSWDIVPPQILVRRKTKK